MEVCMNRIVSLLGVLLLVTSGLPAADAPALLSVAEARRLVGEVVPHVEQLRGLTFKQPVDVDVVDDAAMREYVLARLAAFEQEERLEILQEAYRLLGLIPQQAKLLDLVLVAMEEQAGGYYDPGNKSYYLMDDVPQAAAPIFTAHELTHALEDQHYDLDARLRSTIDNDDRAIAMSAVHEGSATLLMSVYLAGAMLRGEIDAGALQAMAAGEAGKAEKLRSMPDVLVRQLIGPYVLGATFLSGGNLLSMAAGYPAAAIDRAMKEGPTSSEQILHPEKYWDDEQRDEPRKVTIPSPKKALGRGWKLEGKGVLGELTLGPLVGAATPFMSAMPDPAGWTNAAASGWGGDQWQLWRRDGKRLLLLRVDWDSPADAEEFVAALPDGRLAIRRQQERVAIVAGDAGEKTERLLSRMLK
jgi:hypothetical protein